MRGRALFDYLQRAQPKTVLSEVLRPDWPHERRHRLARRIVERRLKRSVQFG